MAYTGEIADRPKSLSGCASTWSETQTDNVVKSEMSSGVLKTRRRFTGIQKKVTCTFILVRDQYDDFIDWYNIEQRQGSIPTRVKNPMGIEQIYLFVTPPVIEWPENTYFTAAVELYAQSGWND